MFHILRTKSSRHLGINNFARQVSVARKISQSLNKRHLLRKFTDVKKAVVQVSFSAEHVSVLGTAARQYSSTPKANLIVMKIDAPEFHALFTPELRTLIDLFEKYNYELRVAGGAVRDLLLGKTSHDLDFATTATPTEMKEMFEKENIRMINMNGESHGTITCRINNKENFEVTTLRIDVVTDGRHAEVRFTTDWQVDALRRDLTINQLFLGFDGTVYDHYNGIADLEARRVCFVGDAASRMQEDYLRILRYFRFYGRISEEPDSHQPNTLRAIRDNMHGLKGISGERIWIEVKKIIVGRHASSLVATMVDLGITQYIGWSVQPNIEQFKRVYDDCHDLDPKPLTLMSALMENENEVYKFHERVKLSRDELRTGLFIVQHRDDDRGPDIFRYCQDLHCDTVGTEPKTKDRIIELLKYLNEREVLEQFCTWQPPKFPVSGLRVIEKGVRKGPRMSKIMQQLRKIWQQSNYELNEEELLGHIDKLMIETQKK